MELIVTVTRLHENWGIETSDGRAWFTAPWCKRYSKSALRRNFHEVFKSLKRPGDVVTLRGADAEYFKRRHAGMAALVADVNRYYKRTEESE